MRVLFALAFSAFATQAAAVPLFEATVEITDAELTTSATGFAAREAETPGGLVSHQITGTLDVTGTINDSSGLAFLMTRTTATIDGRGEVLTDEPFDIDFVSLDGFAMSIAGLGFSDTLDFLSMNPTGSEPVTVPILGNLSIEYDFTDIAIGTDTVAGDFYIGIVEDLTADVLALTGIDLAAEPSLTGDVTVEVTAPAVPLPPAASMMIVAVAGLVWMGRRAYA